MNDLQTTYTDIESGISLHLMGKLTGMSAIELKKDLVGKLTARKQDCHLDMRSVSEMDITGVNALAMAHKAAQRNGKMLTISCATGGEVYDLFHLTKFSNYFNFSNR